MDYQSEYIIDFAKRTRQHLERIEQLQRSGEPVFEVTQLVNSLLGLLVFPQQTYFNHIPETPLSELHEQGWPQITSVEGCLPEDNLKQLMRMLRNSIAHCNVEFFADTRRDLAGVTVWNVNNGRTTWKAKLTLQALRDLVDRFIDLILGQHT